MGDSLAGQCRCQDNTLIFGGPARANKLIVRRTVAEKVILGAVQEKLATPENISYVFKRAGQEVRELGSEVPTTIRLKEAELDAEDRRVANFVEFIAEWRGSKALAGALTLSERRVNP